MLSQPRVVLSVTGSIAAYKAAELARRMMRAGYAVRVVMTENAARFVTPLTFRTITGQAVATELFADPQTAVPHISLAQWADVIVVAPATADAIARVAGGRADDLFSAMILDATAPIIWAPAMNTRMWDNPITQEHVKKLSAMGHTWVLPETGELACGEKGRGRLAEVETIFNAVSRQLQPPGPLQGKKVLITAGPTQEPWDATRFLSNRSTGKMGYAIAEQAQRRGATVILISGPVQLSVPDGVKVIPVVTAQEMYQAAMAEFPDTDVVIAAAAVADFRPAQSSHEKLKKDQVPAAISLVRNPDILLELGKRKTQQLLVGFAAENHDLEGYAREKCRVKNLDFIVANYASGPDSAFTQDESEALLLDNQGWQEKISRQPKTQIAAIICDQVEKRLTRHHA